MLVSTGVREVQVPRASRVEGWLYNWRYVALVIIGRKRPVPPCRFSYSRTRRGASAHGNGFNSTPYATLPTTVVAAIPSAIVLISSAAYAGCRRRRRHA